MLAAASGAHATAGTQPSHDWYAIDIGGARAGHAETRVERRGDRWLTSTESSFRLRRGRAVVVLSIRTRVVEDDAGLVHSFEHAQTSSESTVVTRGRTAGGQIELRSGDSVSRVAYPAGALGPAAVDRRLAAAGTALGTTVEALAFATDAPARASRVRFAVGPAERRPGFEGPLRRVDVENSASAARSHVMWLDGTARMVESVSDVPGLGALRMVRTSEADAKAAVPGADVLTSTFVVPSRLIPSPRRAVRAVFRLRRRDGSPLTADIPTGSGQTVHRPRAGAAGSAIGAATAVAAGVEVTVVARPRPARAWQRPVRDARYARWLAATPMLDAADANVLRHARAAVGDETDAVRCADRIASYVRRFIDAKGYDVGFASASETVRTRRGDCSEHAVLAAAMARAVGLPSRVVSGIVAMPAHALPGVGPRGAFGYHMWAEALVGEDVWWPMDAALGAFDATHIALGRSDLAMEQPVGDLVLPLLETIGDLAIDVVEVESAPRGGRRGPR